MFSFSFIATNLSNVSNPFSKYCCFLIWLLGNKSSNAFSNFTGQQTNIYNRLTGLAQLGLSGATGSANAQLGTATNVANLGIGAANAVAGGQIGSANAYANTANTLGNIGYGYAMQNMNSPQSTWSNAGYGSNAYQNAANPALQEGSSQFVGPSVNLA